MRKEKNEQLNFLGLALTVAGCFLGAGYVSGQEVLQFFGKFGSKGFIGLIVALGIMSSVSYMAIRMNQATGRGIDKLAMAWDVPVLKTYLQLLILVMMVSVSVVMTAGAGALIERLTGIPSIAATAVFVVIAGIMSLSGLSGLVSVFSVTVPIVTGFTVIFAVINCANNGFDLGTPTDGASGSWFLSALTFACYNLFGCMAIFTPLGTRVNKKSGVISGVVVAMTVLLCISAGEFFSMNSSPDVKAAELPMLELALRISGFWGSIYGILLLFAMFGTTLSTMITAAGMICSRWRLDKYRIFVTSGVAIIAFAASAAGFGNLIGTLYPIFGYTSCIFVIMLIINFVRMKKKNA